MATNPIHTIPCTVEIFSKEESNRLFTQYGLSQYIDTTGRKTLPSKELRCIGQTIWGNKEVRVYFLEEPQWDTPLKAEVAFLTPLKEYEVFKNIILRESHVVGSINLL